MNNRILIIGGVAAGASAAAKARRTDEAADITVLDKGPYISFANCGLPFYIGGVIKRRDNLLVHTPSSFGLRFNVDIRVNTEALGIDPKNKTVNARSDTGEYEIPYDKLIIATGAATVVPPIKGLDSVPYFTMRTMDDVDAIHDHIVNKKPQSAVIIGAGYIGIETAEAMRHCGIETTIVEAMPHILPFFAPEMTSGLADALTAAGIKTKTGISVTEVGQKEGRIEARLSSGETLSGDMLFLCTGVRPNTALAESAGLAIGDSRGIAVNERMQTNDPNIYAAGDATEKLHLVTGKKVLLPLAGPANREGRTAGCNAAGGGLSFRGVIGTSIVGFMEHTIAQTGIDEKTAADSGFDPAVIFTENAHTAEYYPEAKGIFLKLIYDKKSGKLLGASASGTRGVDKRIDVLATAIYAGLSVKDLEHLELAYAPQYGSAKDLVNMSGFIAANQIRGQGYGLHPEAFLDLQRQNPGIQIIDVRTPIEYKMTRMDGAVHIPVNDLRANLEKIDRDRPAYVYCAVGYRGYIAARLLRHLGIEAYNILGGIKAFDLFRKIA